MHRLKQELFQGAIVADADRIAAALRYQQELEAAQRPATMNPNIAAQGAAGRSFMAPPESVMDERYPAWKKSQNDAETLMMATDLVGSAIPLAGPAVKGAAALGRFAGPELARGLENYMVKSGGILPMDTWHGSPHRFPPTAKNPLGEFDPTKIGTGEGAQAYGAGAGYLAENKGLAVGYQKDVTRKLFDTNSILGWGEGRVKLNPGDSGILFQYARGTLPPIEAAKKLKINAGSAGAYSDETIADAITKIREQTKGNLYKVDLADEQIPKMLDWDKPFNKQHPEVQQALVNIANGEDEGSKMLKLMQNGNPSGKDIFHSLLTEPQLIDSPSGWISVDNKKEISKLLQSEGIPGIRYLDQGSRAAGAGTSNFVVFDPKHMNIIGRE